MLSSNSEVFEEKAMNIAEATAEVFVTAFEALASRTSATGEQSWEKDSDGGAKVFPIKTGFLKKGEKGL